MTDDDKGFKPDLNRSLQDIVDTQAMAAPADAKPETAPPTEQVLDKPIAAPIANAAAPEAKRAPNDGKTDEGGATASTDTAASTGETASAAKPGARSGGHDYPSAAPAAAPHNIAGTPHNAAGTTPTAPGPVSAPQGGARPISPEPIRPTGPSLPTILLGLAGVIVGLVGLVLGLWFPNVTMWLVGLNPQAVSALAVGGIGVACVVVAIVWAVAKAVAGARRRTGEPHE
ncbi:hypothetical protein [Bifidobacterium aesculapii]|uniref:hypothetical protein n=1 Tax=Bifidobacterium aesculapii TaxID=1329411 RepID=UPI0006E13054|nr:hypothetical protein [Bifidobacterium aesculapii]